MSEQMRKLSPLLEIQGSEFPVLNLPDVSLEEIAFLGHFNIRMQPDDSGVLAAFADRFGIEVPHSANTFAARNGISCAWLGPDEWLLLTTEDRIQESVEKLTRIAADGFVTWANLSSAQTVIRVCGRQSVDLLCRGIVFDLHPRAFQAGQCAQTTMAGTAVTILNRTADDMAFDLIVRRSFADHLWRWLVDVGQEAEFRSPV